MDHVDATSVIDQTHSRFGVVRNVWRQLCALVFALLVVLPSIKRSKPLDLKLKALRLNAQSLQI